ncbi:DUF937 domain-containing protein [Marinicella rhabdoformis]|uniref:DUF937 domain-containing protein n=1 Tax=Marinicella rhabdoformis TaxID=2580566 RepID=UPI0012AEB9CB|nr:DUF937 domain-containing protein [Marinicella rhabdoformis]
MSGILDLIKDQVGGELVEQMVGQVSGNKEGVQRAVAAALPMLVSALQKNAQSVQGANALANALEKDHDGGILDQLGSMLGQGKVESMGDKILGHVLGSKQGQVNQGLAKATGMGGQDMGKILASLAPVVMGALGKTKREKGLDASGLQDLLTNERGKAQQKQPQLGMLEGLLDADGDGDLDVSDFMKKGSGLLKGFFS